MADVATEELSQEQQEVQAEQEFAQGFGKAPEKSAPEQKADEKTEAGTTEANEETPQKKEDAPADSPRIAGLSEAEFNAAVMKATGQALDEVRNEVRKNFGQIGELNRAVQEAKASFSAGRPGKRITADLLKRVNAELPGLGDALAADLSEVLGAAGAEQAKAEAKGQTFDQEKFWAEKVEPALKKTREEANLAAEEKVLRFAHPDYRKVIYANATDGKWTPEFEAWAKAQDPEKQKLIQNSEDAIQVAGFVTEFKAAAEKAKKEKEQKAKRLESAVTPRGVPGGVGSAQNEDEEAEFAKGFSKAGRQYAR